MEWSDGVCTGEVRRGAGTPAERGVKNGVRTGEGLGWGAGTEGAELGSGSRVPLAPGEAPTAGSPGPPADVCEGGGSSLQSGTSAPTTGAPVPASPQVCKDRGISVSSPPHGHLPHAHTLSSLSRPPKGSPPQFSPPALEG